MEPTQNVFLKWALIIGIAIVLNLFFNYSISLIKEAPDYRDYSEICKNPENLTPAEISYDKTAPIKEPRNYCEKADSNYQKDLAKYEKMVFLILVPIGIALFLISFFLKKNPTISSALALGAVIDLIVASTRYWSNADNILRVSILFIALVILIGLAYKKFNVKA